MENVICDICGSEYPETEAQCPLCGCARSAVVNSEEQNDSYVKGGRFSRTNVKKRLNGNGTPVNGMPTHEVPEEYDDDEDEQPHSNWGLISIVILLLLAIIAVSSYIAISFLDGEPGVQNNTTTIPTTQTQRIPCTDIDFPVSKVVLNSKDSTYQLVYSLYPVETTEKPTFTSKDPSIATVDPSNGTIKAVSGGTTVITVTCGAIVDQIQVECQFGTTTAPTTQPTTSVKPTLPQNSQYKVPSDATAITPKKVKVTNDYLNIRTGPGTSYDKAGQAKLNDVFTVYATYTAEGYDWGLTDSGWIALKYTVDVIS